MKKPEEIKKGLECCQYGLCNYCPYDGESCGEGINADALALIKQLETANAKKDKRIAELEQELATVKQERDAAVADLGPSCCTCKHNGEIERYRQLPCGYEWRGVCPENTEVQGDGRGKTD